MLDVFIRKQEGNMRNKKCRRRDFKNWSIFIDKGVKNIKCGTYHSLNLTSSEFLPPKKQHWDKEQRHNKNL